MRFFISAGERSGDMHAANLLEAIRRIEPEAEFVGLGRERLIEAGMRPVEDMRRHSVMWFDAAAKIPRLMRLLKRCKDSVQRERPDAVILVDYVGFNLFLAKAAAGAGLPVFYYVAPQLWAHGAYRAVKLRKWVRRMLVIYPFEVPFYEERGIPVTYVGHPIFDEAERRPPREDVVEALRERLGPELIGVMPGSRTTEVRRHGRLLTEAAARIRRGRAQMRFAMPESGDLAALRFGPGSDDVIEPVAATVPELARAAGLCIVKSGTTTLEVGAARCPMVVFYKVSPFAGFIAGGLRTSPHICLVNQLAGRRVVPERLMLRRDSAWIADRVEELLAPARAEEVEEQLKSVMAPYAAPGASEKAARTILDAL